MIGFQLLRATVGLCIVYMACAIINLNEVDMLNIIGLVTHEVYLGLIIALLTTLCALIVGLPIRLQPQVNSWWRRNPGIWIGTLGFGVFLMIVAWNDNFSEVVYVEPENPPTETPHYGISIAGWCFIAFGLVHSYFHEACHKLFGKFYRSWES